MKRMTKRDKVLIPGALLSLFGPTCFCASYPAGFEGWQRAVVHTIAGLAFLTGIGCIITVFVMKKQSGASDF